MLQIFLEDKDGEYYDKNDENDDDDNNQNEDDHDENDDDGNGENIKVLHKLTAQLLAAQLMDCLSS